MNTDRKTHHTFYDKNGNVYKTEQACNGMWIVMRYNSGGNRKRFKELSPHKRRNVVIERLNQLALKNEWRAE